MATDIRSGFFIALLALPLSLGIAMASSTPPIAGIITAVVGGMVASLIGGSRLAIKGPAAGLIVIVLAAVTELGSGDVSLGYRRMLAVAAVAAVLQIIFSIGKLARFGRVLPPMVIHGMLAAIGVIIVAKQLHILFGSFPKGKTPFSLLMEIPSSIIHMNPEIALIGITTLVLVILLPLVPVKTLQKIPPVLFALAVVVPMGLMWHIGQAHDYRFFGMDFHLGPEYLVNLPTNIISSLTFPDFSVLTEPVAYKFIIMLALVGSVESVLTVIAVDSLSRAPEKTDLSRDLLSVGISNLICAMIGGLPMISEVVRSKANIDSGAKTIRANFFHGVFLLLAVSWLAPIIKEIPLAALAAMLVLTGYRLAKPLQFVHAYKVGRDQLMFFVVTLVVTLATDLLLGVIVGTLLKLMAHRLRGLRFDEIFGIKLDVEDDEQLRRIKVKGSAVFTNCLSLESRIMRGLNLGKKVHVDFSHACLVDHTTLACLEELAMRAKDRLLVSGLEKLNRSSDHTLATHRFA